MKIENIETAIKLVDNRYYLGAILSEMEDEKGSTGTILIRGSGASSFFQVARDDTDLYGAISKAITGKIAAIDTELESL